MDKLSELIKSLGGRKSVISILVLLAMSANMCMASLFLQTNKISGTQWVDLSRLSVEVCIGALGIFSLANVSVTNASLKRRKESSDEQTDGTEIK